MDAANAVIQTNVRGGIALGQTRKQAKTTDGGSLVATRSNQVKHFKNSTDSLNIKSINPWKGFMFLICFRSKKKSDVLPLQSSRFYVGS